ncbi:DegT/DnrJ/EryC1/StrS family aminotransferase [Desulfoluna spongiiphila]|uniref:UDP-2-acetamido-2-deoxy-ribo-hexuluronate aminotransferase n=1 Tax=Desulfoluna spongiiphila TaxID=419481 RepID=A0A1G5DAK5_9BACT|nr:DegT/DnrJ/EryC1/StrS family aminotransferase [Desulfoluna spongiiphila]SCY11752.1 UDP-2-acetamido-2-deoxy-ribo-hexuluronate aminotransferase [Desulfoluna spongiiphila]
MQFIDLRAQYDQIEKDVNDRIHAVLKHGQYINGPEVRELEQRLADFAGTPHCIGAASGTGALLMAMMALGISSGDEVITSPFSFVATAETIALLGAVPVFVDIQADTCNIDPSLIEAAITDRTKAIMAVSLFGQCADFDAINAIARRHGLPVIEDAAQSFGATSKGRKSCNLTTIGCTSFFPSKPLGCYGDGGACFTADEALATRMREIREHGQDRRYHHPRLGINGRLDSLQAAVLLAKLPLFPGEIEKRRTIGARYTQALAHDRITTPVVRPHNTSVYSQYTIRVGDRNALKEALRDQRIPTAVHYPVPLHHQPVFRRPDAHLPVSDEASAHVLSLPMHPYLTHEEIHRVATAVRETV